MNRQIRMYEELSINAHPSLKTNFHDGWMLRFSNGYTNRANSVNMLYSSELPIVGKIEECENRYKSSHLPCVFKVVEQLTDASLDEILESRGYKVVTPTISMSMNLTDKAYEQTNAIILDAPSEEWFDTYIRLEKMSDETKIVTMKEMIHSIVNKSLYCLIKEEDRNVACASAVIENGYMALLNVIVDEQYRGKGYGRQLCLALLEGAKKVGAHTAYLQVVDANQVAVNLYTSLGYRKDYSYYYRVK